MANKLAFWNPLIQPINLLFTYLFLLLASTGLCWVLRFLSCMLSCLLFTLRNLSTIFLELCGVSWGACALATNLDQSTYQHDLEVELQFWLFSHSIFPPIKLLAPNIVPIHYPFLRVTRRISSTLSLLAPSWPLTSFSL